MMNSKAINRPSGASGDVLTKRCGDPGRDRRLHREARQGSAQRATEARLDLARAHEPAVHAAAGRDGLPGLLGGGLELLLDDDFEWLGHVNAPCRMVGRWEMLGGRRSSAVETFGDPSARRAPRRSSRRWDGWPGRCDGDGRRARPRRDTWRPGRPRRPIAPRQRRPDRPAWRSAPRRPWRRSPAADGPWQRRSRAPRRRDQLAGEGSIQRRKVGPELGGVGLDRRECRGEMT